jgi:chemotaxis protein MotB
MTGEKLLSRKKRNIESDDSVWLTSLADLMTLIACFFILLVSLANFDDKGFQEKAEKIQESFTSQKISSSSKGHSGRGYVGKGKGYSAKTPKVEPNIEWEPLSLLYVELQKNISSFAEVKKNRKKETVEIEMVGEKIFETASAVPTPDGLNILKKIMNIILTQKDDIFIEIEGHSDYRKISMNKTYPSNWELSAARASYVVRKLMESGVEESHLKAVGFGSSRPAFKSFDSEGKVLWDNLDRNRRIVFIVKKF